MRNPYEVLLQKELELLEVRQDLSALYRIIPLLAESKDAQLPQKITDLS